MSQGKRAAGRAAADRIDTGMRIGLGTGSTVFFTLERIAERVRDEGLRVVGVPTSLDTERKATAMGIPLATLAQVEALDLTIDGADEIDARLDMIKGGGGALLREKVVASISRRELIVVDAAKYVERLGRKFLLPIEVVPFARPVVRRALERLGGRVVLRLAEPGRAYATDNGNEILDVAFPDGIAKPAELEARLDAIHGIVETGLFCGLAHELLIGHDDGRVERKTRT
jgi:ribose 5-phosphate isomerase A